MAFLIQQVLKFMVPLMIVALAGVFAERSGIINIAFEGIMIFGSFVGALVVYFASPTAGVYVIPEEYAQWVFLLAMLVAALAGAAFSLLLSFSAVRLKADQTIGGTALNLMAPAIVLFSIEQIVHQKRLETPYSGSFVIFNENIDPNSVFAGFFDKVYISTYITILVFVVLSLILYKTKFGLRLRSCGEHPQAADSVGINVYKMRYIGTTISGALAGLGGYIYIVTTAAGSAEGTVHGMGFMALAIMIFGNWRPLGIVLGSLLFGLLKTVSSSYMDLDINENGVYFLRELALPSYLYRMLPYILTLVVLAFTSKKSRCPKAEGIPYDKGRR